MGYKIFLIFLVILYSNLIIHFITSKTLRDRLNTRYALRIYNLSDCQEQKTNKVFFKNVGLSVEGYDQRVSCYIYIEETFTIKKLMVHFERCRDFQYACEYFQTWNFTNYCLIALMKNQVWSPIAQTIQPTTWRKTCPKILKGFYNATNAYVDVNKLLMLYPDAAEYHWRGRVHVFDTKNQERYCIAGGGFIAPYNPRISNNSSIVASNNQEN